MAKTPEKRKDDTCAACGCKLDASAVKVQVGEHVVEVCCEDCAQRLREARHSTESQS